MLKTRYKFEEIVSFVCVHPAIIWEQITIGDRSEIQDN